MAAPTPPVGLSPAQLGAMLPQGNAPAAAPAPPTSLTCPNCNATNESRLRFCMTCGTRLPGAPTPAPGTVAPVAQQQHQQAQQQQPHAQQPHAPQQQAPQPHQHAPQQQPHAPQQQALQQHPHQHAPQQQAPQQQHAPALVPQPILQPAGAGELSPTPFTGSPSAPPALCGRCHGSNDPGSTFCRFCGAQLAQQGAATAAPPAVASGAPAASTPPVTAPHTVPVAATKLPESLAVETRQSPTAPESASPARPAEPLPPEPSAGAARALASSSVAAEPVATKAPVGAEAASPTHAAKAASKADAKGRVVVVAKDGSESASFPLQERVDVGRYEGELRFPEDPYLSARHLRIYERAGAYYVKDLGTLNGTFLRLRDGESVAIEASSLFLVGQQLLRLVTIPAEEEIPAAAREHGVLLFGTPPFPRYARLEQRSVEGTTLDVYHLHKTETVLGRESGDVVFSDDAFLSRRHAAVRFDKSTRKFELVDLHSSNGSFARIGNEVELRHRDQVRVGQQLLRIELNDTGDKTDAGKSEGGNVPRSRG